MFWKVLPIIKSLLHKIKTIIWESYPGPSLSCFFMSILLHSGRWARKASLWPFHNKETGWHFVTLDKNDIANKWYNQDLQRDVLTFRPEFSLLHLCFLPKKKNDQMFDVCFEYFLCKFWGLTFTITFYFPTEGI